MDTKRVYAVSGIDTDIGKTAVTGIIARQLHDNGVAVFTGKVVQTGCTGISEDILAHRALMGISPTAEDQSGMSCPFVYPVPCSPHLAASLAGAGEIDLEQFDRATAELLHRYDLLLIEGAGGLSVPLRRDLLFVDWLAAKGYPLLLVTSPRLGSINHTLAAVEQCSHRRIDIGALLYNMHAATASAEMIADSAQIITEWLHRFGFSAPLLPVATAGEAQPDFSFLAAGLRRRAVG